MEIGISDLQLDVNAAIDLHISSQFVVLLNSDFTVEIYDTLHLSLNAKRHLTKSKSKPKTVYADDQNVFVGYTDGTMEILSIDENFNLLRITEDDDAAGPGNPEITSIASSDAYVLVKANENGLLIYSKPSILFYKWIMIGGHTIIKSHSIRHHLLFVLTETNEIHLLNFHWHRIWEQVVRAYQYIDIEFDGIYLYAASTDSLLLYVPAEDPENKKQRLVAKYKFDDKIRGLSLVESHLLVIFDRKIQEIIVNISDINHPEIQPGDICSIPANFPVEKLKYGYHQNFSPEFNNRNLILGYKNDQSMGKIVAISF